MGSVYKIIAGDKFYYGSTTDPLPKRFSSHKSNAKVHPERPLYKACDETGWSNVILTLVERVEAPDPRFPINREDLRVREDVYIQQYKDDPNCLNLVRSVDEYTKQERDALYYQANKERIKQQVREYAEQHKEEVLAKKRMYTSIHKDEKAEYDRQYRQDNKEKKAERDKAYREANKEAVVENKRLWKQKVAFRKLVSTLFPLTITTTFS
jgi:hypothetical protein